VNALAVSGSTLYAGGDFTTAGGSAANYIAQWNGSSWSALGSGMNSDVYALAVSGSTLYAGGDFTTAGGSAANYIAQWNGSSWSALGSGMNGAVL
jgi:trimeric autotransporter adhesin